MPQHLNDAQLKAAILEFLVKKGRWGAHYFPLATMVNWLGRRVRRNGKRVLKAVKDLTGEGYVIRHKKGATLSLNPARSRDIADYIARMGSRSRSEGS